MVNSKRPSIAARAVLPNRSSPFSLYSAASSSSLRTVYHTTTATTTNTHGYSIQAYTVRPDSGARESLKTKSEMPQGYKQGIRIRKGYVFTGRVHGGLSTGGPAENPVGYETVERGEIVVHNQGESGPDCGSGPKTVEPGPSFGNGRRHSQHSKRRREPLVPPDTLSCKTELQKEHGLEIRQETVCLQLHDVSSETDFSSGHSSVEQSSGAEKNAQDLANPHPGSDFEKGKQLVPVNNLQTTPDSKYPEPTEETWKGTPTVMSQQPIKPPWAEIIAQQFSKSELIMPSLIQACEKIGADTLDRRLRKLLHVYHTDLVRCATTPIQQKACRQLRSEKRKAKICSVIRSRLNLRSWGRIDTALRHFGQKTRRPATPRKRPQNQTEEKRFLFGGPGYRRLVELCTHLSLPEIQWKAEVKFFCIFPYSH